MDRSAKVCVALQTLGRITRIKETGRQVHLDSTVILDQRLTMSFWETNVAPYDAICTLQAKATEVGLRAPEASDRPRRDQRGSGERQQP
jgi:hypothetical protein